MYSKLGGLAVADDKVQDARHVAADERIRREQRQIGVDARRLRVVVARADVTVRGGSGPRAAR